MTDAGGYIGEAMRERGAEPYHATVQVFGEPVGQPRARASMRNGKVRVYDSGGADGWKFAIAAAFRDKLPDKPIDGPVRFTARYWFTRPAGHYGTGRNEGKLKPNAPRRHTKKPDLDNLDKAVMDVLTRCGVWRDDSQVCERGESGKGWAVPGDTAAGVVITVEELV